METVRLYNTMTRSVEELQPLEPGHVKLYCCGPTVYARAHIGNLRKYVCDDLLVRTLRHAGYKVTHVMNITDVDDKIIRAAPGGVEEIRAYTKPYTEAFFEDTGRLFIDRPTIVCPATEHIEDMVGLVKRLVDRGFAYESEGSYYYRIGQFPEYGKLAHLDLGGMKAGARVEVDEYEKDDVRDFALWKARKEGEVYWATELGEGRPGWHIECSAMAMRYLGETFDIHTGGVDNCFPHHENEIAQSEGATGKPFVRHWIHHEHLILDGEKMAKSLGNVLNLPGLLEAGHDPRAIRYLMVSSHNRTQLNFTLDGLEQARQTVKGLRDFLRRLDSAVLPETSEGTLRAAAESARAGFFRALYDDLQTPQALSFMFDLEKQTNIALQHKSCSRAEADRVRAVFADFDSILQVLASDGEEDTVSAEVDELIRRREEARARRDWAEADAARARLTEMGIVLEDTPDGTRWRRV